MSPRQRAFVFINLLLIETLCTLNLKLGFAVLLTKHLSKSSCRSAWARESLKLIMAAVYAGLLLNLPPWLQLHPASLNWGVSLLVVCVSWTGSFWAPSTPELFTPPTLSLERRVDAKTLLWIVKDPLDLINTTPLKRRDLMLTTQVRLDSWLNSVDGSNTWLEVELDLNTRLFQLSNENSTIPVRWQQL